VPQLVQCLEIVLEPWFEGLLDLDQVQVSASATTVRQKSTMAQHHLQAVFAHPNRTPPTR